MILQYSLQILYHYQKNQIYVQVHLLQRMI